MRRGILSHPSGEDGTRGFDFLFCGGTLLPFALRACCRGMRWPADRPATHAAAGAAARGIRGLGVAPASGRMLPEHGLTTGVVRHACRLRRDGTRIFWFAAGAAARGVPPSPRTYSVENVTVTVCGSPSCGVTLISRALFPIVNRIPPEIYHNLAVRNRHAGIRRADVLRMKRPVILAVAVFHQQRRVLQGHCHGSVVAFAVNVIVIIRPRGNRMPPRRRGSVGRRHVDGQIPFKQNPRQTEDWRRRCIRPAPERTLPRHSHPATKRRPRRPRRPPGLVPSSAPIRSRRCPPIR